MEELSTVRKTIPRLEAGGQTSSFSIDPHSLTKSLKSGGCKQTKQRGFGQENIPSKDDEKKEVQLRGVKKGKTSKRYEAVQGRDLGREHVLG